MVSGTLLGLMGTDLVLPAIPSLPQTLGGGAAAAQLVLAAYVGGTGVGLLAFGALGDRFATRTLLIGSLLLTGLASLTCAWAPTAGALIALRALQGVVASGPAVFAPGICRAMFDEASAVRALGALGGIESLAPALAPVLGAWLLGVGGWPLSFQVMAGIALALAALNLAMPLVPQVSHRPSGRYTRLLADPVYLRYALSQALALGGLQVLIFGAPAVLVRTFGGPLTNFLIMQGAGIAAFFIAANLAGILAARHSFERVILAGTLLATAGAAALLAYALAGGASHLVVTALFVPVNGGLGLRGPPGFYRAVAASGADDARGSALANLFIMLTSALGTAGVGPFIEKGLVPLATASLMLEVAGLACFLALPKLVERG